MKVQIVGFFLCCFLAVNALAQPQYFLLDGAIQDFSRGVFYQYEDIQINWNMEGKIQSDLNDGINDLIEEKPGLAFNRFSSIIERDSLFWQAYYFRGVAQKLLGKNDDAYHDLKHALQVNPKFYEGYIELAKICYLLNLTMESYDVAKQALQFNQFKAVLYYIQGEILSGQYQVDKALDKYRTCLLIDSTFHSARIRLAIIELVHNKNEQAAIRELNQVLKANPIQRYALMLRSILVFDKNAQQTLQDLSKLIQINPNNLGAYYLRGLLYTNLQQYYLAFSDFQKVMKGTATSDNNFKGQRTWIDKKIDIQNVGAYILTRIYGLDDEVANKIKQVYCHIMIGDNDKSFKLLTSISTSIHDPLIVYLKAVVYEHKGDHYNAFRLYNQAIELDNTIFDAYKKRGIYEQEMKQWDKSIQDFTTALRIISDLHVLYKLRGISYYNFDNQFQKAIDNFNLYLKFDSTDVQAISYRGMAYLKNNQTLNAYIDFANSSTLDTLDYKFMRHLVDSALTKGDTAKAEIALKSFIKAAPAFTEAYVLKFKLNIKKNMWSEPEAEITKALSNIRVDAPKPDQAYLLTLHGMILVKNQQTNEGLKRFTEALKLDNKNPLPYYERGKLLASKKKTDKAIHDFEKATALGSKEAEHALRELESQ